MHNFTRPRSNSPNAKNWVKVQSQGNVGAHNFFPRWLRVIRLLRISRIHFKIKIRLGKRLGLAFLGKWIMVFHIPKSKFGKNNQKFHFEEKGCGRISEFWLVVNCLVAYVNYPQPFWKKVPPPALKSRNVERATNRETPETFKMTKRASINWQCSRW